jgi:hypothetical protein
MAPQVAKVQRLPYDAEKFVGDQRIELVDMVVRRIRNCCQGEPLSEPRLLAFTGEVGIGKTWLLTHMYYELNKKKKEWAPADCFFVHRIELRNRNETDEDFDPTYEVIQLLRQLAQDLLGEAAAGQIEESSLPGLSQKVISDLRDLLQDHVLVLLLDAVYEADYDLLELFEDYLLGPLALEPNVLIVMASRGQRYAWTTPQLVRGSDLVELRPFSAEEVADQVAAYGAEAKRHISRIYEIGQGVPLATYCLAHDLGILRDGQPSDLENTLDQFLSPVHPDQRPQVKANIRALCVLNAFDDDRIMVMMPKYRQLVEQAPPTESLSFAESVTIRRQLVREALARYVLEDGAYVLDGFVRKLAEETLKRLDPDQAIWRSLHETAAALYANWQEKYSAEKERWAAEKAYHELQLEQS